ncbi:MAG: sulfotransferase [Gammaproteobacteria bacterium]|nr:sulfotransferase [Gammaproteobacteria bacterium]
MNLIIAGVNKAGTTSLFSMLAAHPEVCGSLVKETCYFLPIRYGGRIGPIQDYERQFQHCGRHAYLMESTPGYFYGGKEIAEAIKETLGSVRVVVVLREPVSRAFSFFRFQKAMLNLPEGMSFTEYVTACGSFELQDLRLQENNAYFGLEGGNYGKYLQDWVGIYGQELKIVFFEDLANAPQDSLGELLDWLGLDNCVDEELTRSSENVTVAVRWRQFQRFALTMNRHYESFFRRHPGVKWVLRRAYYSINGDKKIEEFPEETRRQLIEYYRASNRQARSVLSSQGYDNVPEWLSEV